MIKIYKDGVEIDIVKDTLTITRDSKILDEDFKIQANSYPFMIVENDKTRLLLGSKLATSVLRNTYHLVTVLTPEGTFEGELQILKYLKNFRKCNLKFYSPIFNLREKKLPEFMPKKISVIPGIIQPVLEFEEKRTSLIPKTYIEHWGTYGANIQTKGFPQTLFNLPNYFYPNKFGSDLEEGDDWYRFRGTINGVVHENGNRLSTYNSYSTFAGELVYDNKTINSPQVYLLAPLKQAVESVGYSVKGTFYENEFIKRILFYSEKDNLCEVQLDNVVKTIPYTPGGWQTIPGMSFKFLIFNIPVGRRYKLEMRIRNITPFNAKAQLNVAGTAGNLEMQIFENPPKDQWQTYSVEFVPPYTGSTNANAQITFFVQSWINMEFFEVNYIRVYEVSKNKGYLTHPIINLQRYVPEWTFIEYVNELKKLFNLKITPNDHEKTISFDFLNEKFAHKWGVKIDSVYTEDPETNEYDSVLLKYDNDIDENVFITKENSIFGVNKTKEHTKELVSKFKFMPVNTSGLQLSKEIEDKGGVGLIIYDHLNVTTASPTQSYQGYNLTLKNIYENNYKLTLRNYLSSGYFHSDVFLSTRQIKVIAEIDFVFIDNSRYYVNSMSYKETPNGMYQTKLELILMLY